MTKDKEKQRRYWREHYHRHKKKYQKERTDKQKVLIAFIAQFKDKPCMDCHTKFPLVCMDFDHTKNKKFNVSHMPTLFKSHRGDKAFQTILDEIAKCELVCSNCHRIRTSNRRKQVAAEEGFEPSSTLIQSQAAIP